MKALFGLMHLSRGRRPFSIREKFLPLSGNREIAAAASLL
jgi:hypothetical protein